MRTWRTSERAIFQARLSRSANRSATQLAEKSVGRNRSSVPVSLQKEPSWIGLIHWLCSCCPRSLRRPWLISAQSAARSRASWSSIIRASLILPLCVMPTNPCARKPLATDRVRALLRRARSVPVAAVLSEYPSCQNPHHLAARPRLQQTRLDPCRGPGVPGASFDTCPVIPLCAAARGRAIYEADLAPRKRPAAKKLK